MARLTIYRDNFADSTVVSNHFIDEYMKDANDAQLKVYLYLIRMLNANQATSVSDIADKFNHTEKDVMRALKYWEKQQLLDLDFDGSRNLVGIHVRDLNANEAGRSNTAPRASSPTFIPVPAAPTVARSVSIPTVEADSSLADSSLRDSSLMEETDAVPFAKPVYTTDQIRAFKNRQDTAQLLFIAESYIGKPLTPAEMKSILFFTDVLHFSEDLIDYLIQYCVDRGKKDFKYIEKVAVNWAEEGITTPKQAQKFSTKYDKNVYAIMNQLGKNGSPTTKELEYIVRWTKEYGFTMDIIFEACERTVLATDSHRFEYAERILSSWKKEDVHHKSDIRRIDDLYQKRKTSAPSKPSSNRFNQFAQNSYDFDALEKEIISN